MEQMLKIFGEAELTKEELIVLEKIKSLTNDLMLNYSVDSALTIATNLLVNLAVRLEPEGKALLIVNLYDILDDLKYTNDSNDHLH